MKKQVYDLPLQSGPHPHNRRAERIEVHHLVSEMPEDQDDSECLGDKNEFIDDVGSHEDERYNLPRQRQNGKQYIQDQLYENRAINIQNLRARASTSKKCGGQNKNNITHSRIQDKNQKQQNSHFIYLETNNTYSNHSDVAKIKVQSIYEKLLLQEKSKKEKEKFILAQTTFKPKNLHKQLSQIYIHKQRKSSFAKQTNCQKSVKRSSSQKVYKTHQCGSQHKQRQRKSNINKKLEFWGESKTKYEKILQQHFQSKPNSKKGEHDFISNGFKNSQANLRLSKNKQLMIKVTNPKDDIVYLKQKLNRIQTNLENNKQRKLIENKVSERAGKFKTDAGQPKKEEIISKRKPVQWLQLNFYQRQEQIITNRKEKEEKGKQKQTQQVINRTSYGNGSSYKPAMKQSSSTPKLRTEKSTYLQQYYEKIQRKY